MKRWLLATAVLSASVAQTLAAPVSLFNGTLTADASAAAPLGATASLASSNDPVGGGVIQGDVGVTAPDAGTLTISVQDLGPVGDVYEVVLDGASLGLTAPVAVGGPTNSSGSFMASVNAGFHDIGVWDPVLTYLGSDSPYGGAVTAALNPSDFTLSVDYAGAAAVPEAPTLALLGTGLGLLVAGRRYRARPARS